MDHPFPQLDQISTDATRRRIAIDDQAEQLRMAAESANASIVEQAIKRNISAVSSTGRIISSAPWHGDGGEAKSFGKVQER